MMRVLALLMILATGSAFVPSAHKLASSVRTRAPVSAISMSATEVSSTTTPHAPNPEASSSSRGRAEGRRTAEVAHTAEAIALHATSKTTTTTTTKPTTTKPTTKTTNHHTRA